MKLIGERSPIGVATPPFLQKYRVLDSHAARADRLKHGVPLPEAPLAALDQLAGELKIEKL